MQKAGLAAALMVAACVLDACALPPAVMVVSYSADIVSYAATGKTVTDHAYSAVARSDCSFIRILKEKPICVDGPGNAPETATDIEVVQAIDAVPASPAPTRDIYVRIGSYRDAVNAERSAARYAEFHAVILLVTVRGQPFHRVIAGPLSRDEAAALRTRMVAAHAARHAARG